MSIESDQKNIFVRTYSFQVSYVYVDDLSCPRRDGAAHCRPARGDAVAVRDFKDTVFTFYESFCDSSINVWFKKICVFVSSNWGPLTVHFQLYPWNPLGREWASSPCRRRGTTTASEKRTNMTYWLIYCSNTKEIHIMKKT